MIIKQLKELDNGHPIFLLTRPHSNHTLHPQNRVLTKSRNDNCSQTFPPTIWIAAGGGVGCNVILQIFVILNQNNLSTGQSQPRTVKLSKKGSLLRCKQKHMCCSVYLRYALRANLVCLVWFHSFSFTPWCIIPLTDCSLCLFIM